MGDGRGAAEPSEIWLLRGAGGTADRRATRGAGTGDDGADEALPVAAGLHTGGALDGLPGVVRAAGSGWAGRRACRERDAGFAGTGAEELSGVCESAVGGADDVRHRTTELTEPHELQATSYKLRVMETKYESVIGELGQQLELARADAERLEEELMDEQIVQVAHPLYVELLRAQARIDALSDTIELIIKN